MDEIVSEFLTETGESMVELDNLMLLLEQNPQDHDLISKIFRIIHTIKGTCGFLGLPRLEKLAHKTEDVLGLFRDGELTVEPELISVILEVLDEIKLIIPAIAATGHEPQGDDTSLTARLEKIVEGRLGQTISNELDVTVASTETKQIHDNEAVNHNGTIETLRVNVDVLENLMTMVSELVLTRNQLLQINRQSKNNLYETPLQRLNLVVSDLQEGVMKTRMQPVGNAWAKLPRIIRDICQELGKRIDLEMYGQDTELDRQVLEKIKDPLTHMIRNSADHGIEAPSDRLAAGKPETGKIILRSYHQGGHIMIEVTDDGRGLPIEKIRKKILENGLADAEQLEAMSNQQIQQFIFHPGFSTADKISSVSGRGVGMDVVRHNIEKIGGSVEMRSFEGKGTHFTIKIPLTLAIVSALIIGSAGERFAIPQLSVSELVLISEDSAAQIEHVNNSPVLRLRGNLLPLIDLEVLIGKAPRENNDQPRFVVVTKVAQFLFGIIVDQVYDLEEIVVKPVTRLIKDLPIFSGNTILGDGQVIMILDPAGLIKMSGMNEILDTLQSREIDEHQAINNGPETSLLLFKAGDKTLKAAPLQMISRLEKIDIKDLSISDGRTVVKYLGHLMPVESMNSLPSDGVHPLIIFLAGDRISGLIVREIIDITKYYGEIPQSQSSHLLGSVILNDNAVDILRPDWYTANGVIADKKIAIEQRMAAE
jgi:two-component system chemotaxis sensor kinase CheA